MKVYGTQDSAVEELVSRFVRWAVLEGLNLSGISPDGAEPLEADPNYSVGEPNWNDGAPAVSAESGYTCPDCGASYPAGTDHQCEICGYPLAPDTHVCEVCGQTIPAGVEHSHQQEHHSEHH